jgi:hypothetical protein
MKKLLFVLAIYFTGNFLSAQNCFWASGAGSFNNEEGNGVAKDASGDIIATGDFYSPTITFGSTVLTNASNGTPDFYLVKYNPSGTVAWARRAGGNIDDAGSCVTTDAAGNIYVAGYFAGSSITFGTFTLNNSNLGNMDLFLVKYDPNGNVLWARKAGGMSDEIPYGICIDGGGDVVVTGKFHSATMTFGLFTLTNNYPSNNAFFIARWDAAGTPKWAKGGGGNSGQDIGRSVSSDGGANIYVTGNQGSDTLRFGASYLVNADPGNDNIFVAKYDTLGNVQYQKSFFGHDMDEAYGITTDASGNSYLTGYFRSDTIHFGSLYLTDFNAYDFYIAKLDPSGNPLWAHSSQSATDDYGYSIANDGSGNVYATGNYSSSSIVFGSDTLTNPGGAKLFIVKYDSNGNVLWALQSSGTASSPVWYSSIAAFGVDNVCIAGTFSGSAFTLGNVALMSQGQWDMYAAHIYNFSATVPSTTSVSCFGGNDGTATSSVVGGYSPITYAWNNSQTTSTATNLVAGNYTVTVTDGNSCVHSASVTVTEPTPLVLTMTQQNVDCGAGIYGMAAVTAGGGTSPYTYLWNNSQTTSSINNLAAGTYSVVVTDANGCTNSDSVTLSTVPVPVAPICMVTVDQASQYNIVVWDKTPYTDVDSFIIYREIATNDYEPIGAVAYDSLSQFIDTVRTLYFPNTGDPNAGTYRYKIQTRDSCGNYSLLSPYHNTIFITNNNGTFTWAQLYTIEGSGNPVLNYVLLRDNISNGNWLPVSSVAGTQQTISDPSYATYASTGSWRVETFWNISCTPTMRVSSPFELESLNNSFSNTSTSVVMTGVSNNSLSSSVSILPNPNNGIFSVNVKTISPSMKIEIYNSLGEIVQTKNIISENTSIDISNEATGIYFYKVISNNGMISSGKFISE